MRIVAGRHRGRNIEAPAGTDIRPTADRVRESLFNILSHGAFTDTWSLADATILDAFAGSGALGLEALSRGAAHVTFMDEAPAALAAVRKNVNAIGESDAVTSLRADATDPPPATGGARSLVFVDPPYRSGQAGAALTALAGRGWIAAGAVCVAELAAEEDLLPPPGFTATDERRYGKTKLVFLTYGEA